MTIRALRWSERYTKTDMVYLVSNGSWLVFGQISASIIALALAVSMAHFVPKDAYGNYKYVLAIVSILATFSLSGVSTAVFQSIAHGYRSALSDGFSANLRWSGFVFVGAFVVGGYYLLHDNTTVGLGILFGGCAAPFLSSYNLYLSLLTGEKDFRTAAWYGDFVTNIIPALTLGLTAYFIPRPLYLIIAYFTANIVAAAYVYHRSKRAYPDISGLHDTDMLTYGKHLSVMNVLSGIANNIDQVLLFHFVGPVELAIYNFATAIPDQMKGPYKMLDSMVQARFAARNEIDINRGMLHKISVLFVFYLVVSTVYIVCAPLIYWTLFPMYEGAIGYSQLYAISMLAFAFGPAAAFLSVKKKVRAQYVANIATSLFQIVTMVAGIIGWGLLGLILARIISRFFTTGIAYFLYHSSVTHS